MRERVGKQLRKTSKQVMLKPDYMREVRGWRQSANSNEKNKKNKLMGI